jgi:L-lactate dehydrogenase (cytochrome)
MSLITFPELQSHCNATSCWMALHGRVYDLTNFLSQHPGGSAILLKHSGSDATSWWVVMSYLVVD